MTATSIAQVQTQDRARAISTIVSAFASDPVERWLFPNLGEYQALWRVRRGVRGPTPSIS